MEKAFEYVKVAQMKIVFILISVCFLAAHQTCLAMDCAKLARELTQLRIQYKTYAEENSKGGVSFDKLTEILDKIVNLKNEMRKSNCKIPPRS